MRHHGAEPFPSVDWIPTEMKNYDQYYQLLHFVASTQDEAYLDLFGEGGMSILAKVH